MSVPYDEEEMSRTDAVAKGSTTVNNVLKVGDTAVVVKVDLGWSEVGSLATRINIGQEVIITHASTHYGFHFKDKTVSPRMWSVPKDWLAPVPKGKASVLNNDLSTTKEEVNMSQVTRKVVNVQLIDQDAGLPVEFSLVEDFGSIITEDDQTTIIQQLIVDNDLKALIDLHNAVRVEQVDLDIQKRTGHTVKLQPIKLKDLTWIIK